MPSSRSPLRSWKPCWSIRRSAAFRSPWYSRSSDISDEQRVGVEVEPDLGAVPAGVLESGTRHAPEGIAFAAEFRRDRPDSARRRRGSGHNRVMRRPLALAAAAVCARRVRRASPAARSTDDAASNLPRPSVAFCKAAAHYDNKIATSREAPRSRSRWSPTIAAAAPKDIARDAQTFLDTLEEAQPAATRPWSTTRRSRRRSTT